MTCFPPWYRPRGKQVSFFHTTTDPCEHRVGGSVGHRAHHQPLFTTPCGRSYESARYTGNGPLQGLTVGSARLEHPTLQPVNTGDLWGPVELFALDIKAMFPSLNRQDISEAFNTIAHCVVAAPRSTGRPRRGTLRFAINKIDRKLDGVGTGHFDMFHNVHINDVKRYIYIDVFCNDAFVFTNLVLRQTEGWPLVAATHPSWAASSACPASTPPTPHTPPTRHLHSVDSPPATLLRAKVVLHRHQGGMRSGQAETPGKG